MHGNFLELSVLFCVYIQALISCRNDIVKILKLKIKNNNKKEDDNTTYGYMTHSIFFRENYQFAWSIVHGH